MPDLAVALGGLGRFGRLHAETLRGLRKRRGAAVHLADAEQAAPETADEAALGLLGHGPFPLRDAHEHIERAHRTFESMVPPAQILQ